MGSAMGDPGRGTDRQPSVQLLPSPGARPVPVGPPSAHACSALGSALRANPVVMSIISFWLLPLEGPTSTSPEVSLGETDGAEGLEQSHA